MPIWSELKKVRSRFVFAFFPGKDRHSFLHLRRNMEKFCIVKRRRQGFQAPFPSPFPLSEEELSFQPNEFDPTKEANSEPVLSFGLTPGQSRAIRSGGVLSVLGKETSKSLGLNLNQREDGSIVFNFHLGLDHDLMMFKPDQVCRMMQVSRSLLNRMIKEDKIRSHKIGRLRRFCLKDIIEALSQALA
jgi:excisionase family DNA binding protein